MAILDIFKKKKKPEKEKPEKPTEKPVEVKPQLKPPPRKGEARSTKLSGKKLKAKTSALAYRVLKGPHVTEKATDLAKKNQYVFKVWPRTNKVEIKKAIEDLYGAEVVAVKIIKIPRKKRRHGKIEGWKKGYKKAIIKIKKGQKIEVLPR